MKTLNEHIAELQLLAQEHGNKEVLMFSLGIWYAPKIVVRYIDNFLELLEDCNQPSRCSASAAPTIEMKSVACEKCGKKLTNENCTAITGTCDNCLADQAADNRV